jgi:fused signal recognition particle receptor
MDVLGVTLLTAGTAVVGLPVFAFALRHRQRLRVRATVSADASADIRRGLQATQRSFGARLREIFARPAGDADAMFASLEEALIAVDVGSTTAAFLVHRVRGRLGRGTDRTAVESVLREEITALLTNPGAQEPRHRPWVVLVTGVNGVGKTTTIGKLAVLHRAAGRRVLLVAADTFRAAAAEQLGVWAERAGADLVGQAPGASAAAVVFDGIKAAVARQVDIVLVDTAGRLHTRTNLMEELRKVQRVIQRELPGAPHETLLVLDATTGQNAIVQARHFVDAVAVTGLVVTKLDGTARGGVLIAIRRELGIPVSYVGHGEGVGDLHPFDASTFVSALFGNGSQRAMTYLP